MKALDNSEICEGYWLKIDRSAIAKNMRKYWKNPVIVSFMPHYVNIDKLFDKLRYRINPCFRLEYTIGNDNSGLCCYFGNWDEDSKNFIEKDVLGGINE